MYRPYFRGKQFELITIRESAKLLAAKGFVPIIEPVREALRGLEKALRAICDAGGQAIVIVNPYHGDHSADGESISQLIRENFIDSKSISAGILLRSDMSCRKAIDLCESHKDFNLAIVHDGFTEPRDLAGHLASKDLAISEHVFIEEHAELLYRRHFKDGTRILVRDGFKRQRNADYPQIEAFSELHVTYPDMNMSGFGDFLIVGDDYSESGGPAYAVAIHLTFIDPAKEDVMYIYHFVSDTNDTPTDPAGKFAQALQKLIAKFDSGQSNLYETDAFKEFRELYNRGHFPGLGYVKKLSMKHHIETLARYMAK